jgi:hypothetical protein
MGRSPIGCRGHRNEQVLPIDTAAKNTRQRHYPRFSDDLPSLRNGQDGAYASRRVSNRLKVRQLRRPVATVTNRMELGSVLLDLMGQELTLHRNQRRTVGRLILLRNWFK